MRLAIFAAIALYAVARVNGWGNPGAGSSAATDPGTGAGVGTGGVVRPKLTAIGADGRLTLTAAGRAAVMPLAPGGSRVPEIGR